MMAYVICLLLQYNFVNSLNIIIVHVCYFASLPTFHSSVLAFRLSPYTVWSDRDRPSLDLDSSSSK